MLFVVVAPVCDMMAHLLSICHTEPQTPLKNPYLVAALQKFPCSVPGISPGRERAENRVHQGRWFDGDHDTSCFSS